jgi:hypothetical protein
MKFSINVREKGVLLIQVTSSKKSNSYETFNDRMYRAVIIDPQSDHTAHNNHIMSHLLKCRNMQYLHVR